MGALSSGFGLAMGAAGVAMQSYGSYQQMEASQRAAEWNAQKYENDALNQDQLAEDALQRGKSEAAVQQLRARQGRAQARSDYASSGVDINSGSAVDVIADRAAWDEYERGQIITSSEKEAWGYTSQAHSLRQQASMTRNSGGNPWLAGGTTALMGGTQLWNHYTRY